MAISNEMSSKGSAQRSAGHRGSAFLVEALVVLGFLMVALTIFVQLFSKAQIQGLGANQLSKAVFVATNYAEEFSADPTGVEAQREEDGLTATCSVEENKRNGGTLYEATIEVSDGSKTIYTLATARYVSNANGGAQ